MAMTILCFSKF